MYSFDEHMVWSVLSLLFLFRAHCELCTHVNTRHEHTHTQMHITTHTRACHADLIASLLDGPPATSTPNASHSDQQQTDSKEEGTDWAGDELEWLGPEWVSLLKAMRLTQQTVTQAAHRQSHEQQSLLEQQSSREHGNEDVGHSDVSSFADDASVMQQQSQMFSSDPAKQTSHPPTPHPSSLQRPPLTHPTLPPSSFPTTPLTHNLVVSQHRAQLVTLTDTAAVSPTSNPTLNPSTHPPDIHTSPTTLSPPSQHPIPTLFAPSTPTHPSHTSNPTLFAPTPTPTPTHQPHTTKPPSIPLSTPLTPSSYPLLMPHRWLTQHSTSTDEGKHSSRHSRTHTSESEGEDTATQQEVLPPVVSYLMTALQQQRRKERVMYGRGHRHERQKQQNVERGEEFLGRPWDPPPLRVSVF